MIAILSQDTHESTTEHVCDWIDALGGVAVRINGADMNGPAPLVMRYDGGGASLRLVLGERELAADEVRVVWMRRWHTYENLAYVDAIPEPGLAQALRQHLVGELHAATGSLAHLFAHAAWLSHPREHAVNKLRALSLAAGAGLDIPATLVTNDRAELQRFKDAHGRIIVKAIGQAAAFIRRNAGYAMYTVELSQADLDGAPPRFFPSLAQALLDKAFEVRTFYLDGACYSMAMFSQQDARTRMDYRQYNHARPARWVPYRLPGAVADAVGRFMRAAALTTGSLDLVRTPDGRHVFLEVNPAGQFGMVSDPCNYRLEKKVAEYLIARDTDGTVRPRPLP